MFYAILILAVIILIVKLAKTPCGCGCWRWENCKAKCCAPESMCGDMIPVRARQLLTGGFANASIPDPASITTFATIPIVGPTYIHPDGTVSTEPMDETQSLHAPTIPTPLMPLRTITLHKTAFCNACAQIQPAWDKLKADIPGIVYKEVDEDIVKTPGIMGYPTIILRDPLGTAQYRGPPEYEHLRRWATAPVPYWI